MPYRTHSSLLRRIRRRHRHWRGHMIGQEIGRINPKCILKLGSHTCTERVAKRNYPLHCIQSRWDPRVKNLWNPQKNCPIHYPQ